MRNIHSVWLVFVLGFHTLLLQWEYVIASSEEPEPTLEVDPPRLVINSGGGGNLERQGSPQTINEALFSCLEVPENSPPHRPRTVVIWMKDGNKLETKNNRKYRNYGKKKRLLIQQLNEQDSGIYECAFSTNSSKKGRAELWFTPSILEAPTPQELEVQSNGVVFCNVSWSARRVQWQKDGTVVASTEENDYNQDSRFFVHQNGSLLITNVIASDQGLYKCIASNNAGQSGAEIEVTVDTSHLPTIPTSVRGIATPTQELTTPTSDTAFEKACVEYEDISFGLSPSVQSSVPPPVRPTPSPQLGVPRPPSAGGDALHFTAIPPSCIETTVGYTIVLPCSASGNSKPSITWSHNDKQLNISTKHSENGVRNNYVQLPDGSLQITTVQMDDKGLFTCVVQSESIKISTGTRLRVKGVEEMCGVGGGSQRNGRSLSHSKRKRVVLGEQVTAIEEWPWQVLLEYNLSSHGLTGSGGHQGSGSQDSNEQLCGGALIRSDWLLTAAHCLFSHSSWREPTDLIVRVGVFNRSDYSEPHQQLLKVYDYKVHPQYVPGAYGSEHDIALLKLVHPVRPSSNTGSVCLPARSEEPPEGTVCTVTGWGHLEHEAGVSPELLHKAEVPLVSYSRCRHPDSYGSAVTRNMLCAGWREGGPDACQNDSGGPLVCQTNGQWAIYGVVNYGEGCGFPHKYGVYARVTKYVKWINKTMKEFV